MVETIVLGGLELRFLRSKDDSGGSLDLFEMTVQPDARMPVAHHHENWDETVYGLSGVTTWRVDGSDGAVGPGETVFIRRGIVHGFRNDTAGAGDLPVHPDPRRARPRLLPRTGGPARRRRPRSGPGEGDHAAARAGAGGGRLAGLPIGEAAMSGRKRACINKSRPL